MGLFGQDKKKDPKEQVREWSRKMRQEMRSLDRQILSIQREQEKVKRQIKDAAKKNDKDVCRILAKELVQSRKAVSKLYASKAQINSVILNMNHQVATVRLAGSLQKSAEVMQSMNRLIRVPEVAATMRELSKEMMKAGIIEEMLEDTMESMEPDDMEEDVEREVEKVLNEVIHGEISRIPKAVDDTLVPGPSAEEEDVEVEEDMAQMQERLQALRS